MKNLIKKIIIFLVTALLIGGIIYGGMLGDFVETENVGSMLCLSCMGIE
jgi:p-aminobenzoyl-glutamate transporter AbgT